MLKKSFLLIIASITIVLGVIGCAPKQTITVIYPDGTKQVIEKRVKVDRKLFRLDIKTNQKNSTVTVWRWTNRHQVREYQKNIPCNTKTPICKFVVKSKHLDLEVDYEQGDLKNIPKFKITDKKYKIDIFGWGHSPNLYPDGEYGHCLFKLL